MEITEFTFRILILGIPGILSYFLLGRLIRWREKDTALTIFCIFLLGTLSYLAYSAYYLYWAYCYGKPLSLTPIQELFSASGNLSALHIAGTCIASFYLSLVISYAQKEKLFNRMGQRMRITTRHGDEDVWEFFHNSPLGEKNNGWVYIRDHKENLLYYGYISAWSETESIREVVLSRADVYDDSDGRHMYSVAQLYLARQPEDLSIEVDIQKGNENGQSIKPNEPAADEVSGEADNTD
jgi:hypothetical protein